MSGKARTKARTKARKGDVVAEQPRESAEESPSEVDARVGSRQMEPSTDGDESRVEASSMPDRNTDRAPDGADPRRRAKLYAAVAAGMIATVGLAFGGDRAMHGGEVMRGVVVGGRTLAGKDPAAARAAIEELQTELTATPLAVRLRDRSFELVPEMIGFRLDVDRMVDAAMTAGRYGGVGSELFWWLGRLRSDHPLPVELVWNDEAIDAVLQSWEQTAITDPPFEGAIVVEDGKAVVQAPRPGYAIDREAAKAALAAELKKQVRGEVSLPLAERQPERSVAAVQKALPAAEALLAGPVTLVGLLPPDAIEEDEEAEEPKKKREKKEDGGDAEESPPTERFAFEPAAFAVALRSRLVDGGAVEVYLDEAAFEGALAKARERLERPPVDARFETDKRDKVTIVPSRLGRVIDHDAVAAALFAAAQTPEREGLFPIEEGAAPKLTTEDAEALGIDGLVSKFTTTHPCCRPRVKNIHRIADLIDGVILKPGERFSINEHVGERTTRNGFFPAPTIVHGEMKDTIGGGISQFATTFFNAAFYGAYEIIERQPHSYYFSRYPMGHEATLSYPKPDVIIRNDTKSGLLIRCSYGPTSITVKFFGDNEGRKVTKKRSNLYDLVDPPIEYIADDDLDPEEEKVKERGKKGWSVTVSRIIEYPDGKEKEETRKVVYSPRIRKLRVHSCKIPKGEDGYTGRKCPEPEEPEEDDDDVSEDEGIDPAELVGHGPAEAGSPVGEELDEGG